MTYAEILEDFRAALGDTTAKQFAWPSDANLARHLRLAAVAMNAKRPLIKRSTLAWVAGTAYYTSLPSDLVDVHAVDWPICEVAVPRLMYSQGLITVYPTPSTSVVQLVPTVPYRYLATHACTEASMTIAPVDVPLLLLRAQVEAMRELAMRGHQKPVSLQGASPGGTSNMQPSALYQMLLAEFNGRP